MPYDCLYVWQPQVEEWLQVAHADARKAPTKKARREVLERRRKELADRYPAVYLGSTTIGPPEGPPRP